MNTLESDTLSPDLSLGLGYVINKAVSLGDVVTDIQVWEWAQGEFERSGMGPDLWNRPDIVWMAVEYPSSPSFKVFPVEVSSGKGVALGDATLVSDFIRKHTPLTNKWHGFFETKEAGDSRILIVGDCGKAVTGKNGESYTGFWGHAEAGNGGYAEAGNWGTAIAGNWGTALAGTRGYVEAGNDGTAIAGEDGCAIAGERGTAKVGLNGKAKAGEQGNLCFVIDWDERYFRVGQEIKPNTFYRWNAEIEAPEEIPQ